MITEISTLPFSFGEEDKKHKQFKERLDILNEKYIFWLSRHEDIVTGKMPVDLHNYYTLYEQGGKITFKVLNMEDFPKEIQYDLEQAFHSIYK